MLRCVTKNILVRWYVAEIIVSLGANVNGSPIFAVFFKGSIVKYIFFAASKSTKKENAKVILVRKELTKSFSQRGHAWKGCDSVLRLREN